MNSEGSGNNSSSFKPSNFQQSSNTTSEMSSTQASLPSISNITSLPKIPFFPPSPSSFNGHYSPSSNQLHQSNSPNIINKSPGPSPSGTTKFLPTSNPHFSSEPSSPRSSSNDRSESEEDNTGINGNSISDPNIHFSFSNGRSTSGKERISSKAHVSKACSNCKRAHLACDSSRPCRRCLSVGRGDTCIDLQHKKRGRPRLRRTENLQGNETTDLNVLDHQNSPKNSQNQQNTPPPPTSQSVSQNSPQPPTQSQTQTPPTNSNSPKTTSKSKTPRKSSSENSNQPATQTNRSQDSPLFINHQIFPKKQQNSSKDFEETGRDPKKSRRIESKKKLDEKPQMDNNQNNQTSQNPQNLQNSQNVQNVQNAQNGQKLNLNTIPNHWRLLLSANCVIQEIWTQTEMVLGRNRESLLNVCLYDLVHDQELTKLTKLRREALDSFGKPIREIFHFRLGPNSSYESVPMIVEFGVASSISREPALLICNITPLPSSSIGNLTSNNSNIHQLHQNLNSDSNSNSNSNSNLNLNSNSSPNIKTLNSNSNVHSIPHSNSHPNLPSNFNQNSNSNSNIHPNPISGIQNSNPLPKINANQTNSNSVNQSNNTTSITTSNVNIAQSFPSQIFSYLPRTEQNLPRLLPPLSQLPMNPNQPFQNPFSQILQQQPQQHNFDKEPHSQQQQQQQNSIPNVPVNQSWNGLAALTFAVTRTESEK